MHAHAHAHALVPRQTCPFLSAGACMAIMSFGIDNGPHARSHTNTNTRADTHTHSHTHTHL